MQDETQTPGAAAQGPNNVPDAGVAVNSGGSEGFGQDPSSEEPAASPTAQEGSPFLDVDETGSPTGDVEIEMPPDYVRMPPDPAEPAGADAGDVEIEMPPDPVGQMGAPDAAAPADAAVGGAAAGAGTAGAVEIEMPPDYVGQAGADAGGVEIEMPPDSGRAGDAAAGVGEAGDLGETIEAAENRITKIDPDTGEEIIVETDPVTGEEIGTIKIDPDTGEETLEITMEPIEQRVDEHGDVWVRKEHYDEAWDTIGLYQDEDRVEALGDAAEDVGESVVDFVEGIPVVGDDVGDALGGVGEFVENVVDHMDEPVVEDVDPWG